MRNISSLSVFAHWQARHYIRAANVALVLWCATVATARAGEHTTAQQLLFDQPYLQEIAPPAKIHYRFQRTSSTPGAVGENFEDTVLLEIGPPGTDATLNQVLVRMFTGNRARTQGPFSDVTGNPVLLMMLERDLFEMRKRIKGPPVFFRNSMRRSMRGGERVEAIRISIDGVDLPAHTVTVTPYDDANIPPQYRPFRNKTYSFTVSPDVPGGIYEITIQSPDETGRDRILMTEQLTFAGRDNN